jgi:hypothetical protein
VATIHKNSKSKEDLKVHERGKRTLIFATLAVALVAAAASPAPAVAADWTFFVSWWDTTDLEDAFGLGIRGSFPLNQNWEFDITAQYYEDFEEAIPGVSLVEIGTIPVDFGITWNNSAEGGFNAGAGLTWGFMDTGGLEIEGVDIPDIGEADDEFGGYAKLGYRARGGFLVEFLYRFLDVSIESLQLPVPIPGFDRIELDMDGWTLNIGYRF